MLHLNKFQIDLLLKFHRSNKRHDGFVSCLDHEIPMIKKLEHLGMCETQISMFAWARLTEAGEYILNHKGLI